MNLKHFIVLVCLCACRPVSGPAQLRSPAEQHASRVVVISECHGIAEDARQIGSGVVLDNDTIVTAAHVVRCSTIPSITIEYRGRRQRVQLVEDLAMFGDGTDLATLVSFNPLGFPTATIANTWWEFDPKLISKPGDSGSPVYDDLGRLVGIVVTGRGDHGEGGTGIVPLWPHRSVLQ